MVYTGFYKDTILSGVIEAEAERRLFVKVFADRSAHELELTQLESLRQIAPPELALASIAAAGDGVVAYELLGRASRRAPAPMLEQAALALAASAYQRRAASDVDCWAGLLEQVRRRLAHVGADLGQDELRLLTIPPEPTLAHGDFTPWNTFTTIDDRVALVDYERVARRAPFTDVWHLFVQPAALASGSFDSRRLIARVCAVADVDGRSAAAWYRAYLLEELAVDTRDWVEHDRHHPQLQRLIRYKAQLLREAPTSLP
jgi:hypothetical protein